jgi:solute carrier family 25 carnitine/acylcarnitine transporter 20/29
MIYVDVAKVIVPGGLTPFWSGSICANLAWLTIWPLDVIKSQIQSGNYEGYTYRQLFLQNLQNGRMFRGLLPGLIRSFVANGCSMVVYHKILETIKSD